MRITPIRGINVWTSRIAAVAAICVMPHAIFSQQAARPELWGDFEPGPHAVGFRAEYRYDHGRVELPEIRRDGSRETRPLARRMQIGLWYPARVTRAAPRVRLSDYVDLSDYGYLENDPRPLRPVATAERNELFARWVFRRAVFESLDEALLPSFLQRRTLAVRNAPAAAGPYPLILIAPGSGGSLTEHAITAEYLASHGYVVVGAPSRGSDAADSRATDIRVADNQLRDLEYLIGFAAALPMVDARRIGVVSHSWGSVASVLLASRNPTVDAVVSLDGSLNTPAGLEVFARFPTFDVYRVQAPLLVVHSDTRPTDSSFFGILPFAPAHDVTVRGLHHLDFVDFALYHTALGVNSSATRSPPEHVRKAHAWIGRFTRLFFDAHVKGLADSLAPFDGRHPSAAPPAVATVARHSGKPAPPAAVHVYELLWKKNGWREVLDLVTSVRATEPAWTPLTPRVLILTAQQFRELGRRDEVIGVLELNVALNPGLAAAHVALGNEHIRAGDRESAVRSLRRALELEPTNSSAATALRRAEALK